MMDAKEYENWSKQLEKGDYGEFVDIEFNPYYLAHQELEKTLLPVIEIAKKNNISLADLTKTLVIIGYKEGLTPA
jgi:hypothetical protein